MTRRSLGRSADTAPVADKDAEEKPKSKKKLMMIGAVLAAGAAYKFVLAPKPAEPAAADGAAMEATPAPEGEVAPIPELVVNLASSEEVHYARVGVGAVLAEGIDVSSMEGQLPKISDIVIEIVSRHTFEDLREPEAVTTLKGEISEAAAEAFPDGEVIRVIFTTFVMQ
jgi:flagellar basal body-associated protein FliL